MKPLNPKPLAEDADSGPGKNALYRLLPSVNDILLQTPLTQLDLQKGQRDRFVQDVRRTLDRVRSEIARDVHTASSIEKILRDLPNALLEKLNLGADFSLRRVINATGVILHTNLGRAPLSEMALDHLREIAAGYSNLEFDLHRGERGKRDAHVESLLLTLLAGDSTARPDATGRAVIVNNCAAGTFLALHSLARGRQVLVSRSELIEIGGGFRIPEILEESGAVLREVGTTNKTRVSDYERAITGDTALILRVHQSNFTMEGFVERPTLEELASLGRRKGISVFEDQGTGLVEGLEPYGISGEATMSSSLKAGCSLVAASGDKLFGGPQCGILVGHTELIDRIRRNPLFRTFRADKLSYAALEATLIQYLSGDTDSIPVNRMLRTPADTIRNRCLRIVDSLQATDLAVKLVRVASIIGGGAAPKSTLPSYALALNEHRLGASELLAALRRLKPPIIGRIDEDVVLLDLRTVEPDLDSFIIHALSKPIAPMLQDPS